METTLEIVLGLKFTSDWYPRSATEIVTAKTKKKMTKISTKSMPPPLKKMMTSYMNDPFSAAEGVRKVCPLPLPP